MASRGQRYFGTTRKLPSGRIQARYTGPDGCRYAAPTTFDSRQYAEAFLARVHGDIQAGRWVSPDAPVIQAHKAPAFGDYAAAWLAGRDLSPSTRLLYENTLRKQVRPAFGSVPLDAITPAMVREWHAKLRTQTGPTQRAHAYALLRTILGTAVADDVIPVSPCRVRGAGQAKRVRDIRPASLGELEALVSAMPPRYRLMVLLAAWCALRFGELAELRRSDVDVKNGLVHVRRAVARTDDGPVVKAPKSGNGRHAGGTDGAAGSFHGQRGHAVPARGGGPGQGHRRRAVGTGRRDRHADHPRQGGARQSRPVT